MDQSQIGMLVGVGVVCFCVGGIISMILLDAWYDRTGDQAGQIDLLKNQRDIARHDRDEMAAKAALLERENRILRGPPVPSPAWRTIGKDSSN